MMYIKFSVGSRLGHYSWSVDEDLDFAVTPSTVKEVQADGMELEWITKNISGIPIHKTNPTQVWYGDMAKFIVGAIELSS